MSPVEPPAPPRAAAQNKPHGFTAEAARLLSEVAATGDRSCWILFERPRNPQAPSASAGKPEAWAAWTVTTSAGPVPDHDALNAVSARLFAAIENWPDSGFDLTGRPAWRWAAHTVGLEKGAARKAKAFPFRSRSDPSAYPQAVLLVLSPVDAELDPDRADDVARRLAAQAQGAQRKEGQKLLAAAVERMHEGVAIADMTHGDRPILHCNQAFERLTGLGVDDALSLDGPFFARADTDQETRDRLKDALKRGTPLTAEFGLRRAGNTMIWCQVALLALDPEEDQPAQLVITVTDRSAHRLEAEDRIQIQQLLLDAIESTSEGFMLLDRQERIVLVNNRYRELYPAIANHLQAGEPFADVLHAMADAGLSPRNTDRRVWIRDQLERLRAPGSGTLREEQLIDGRVIRVSDRPTASGGTVSIRTDITALRRADDLSRLRLHAIEASRDGIVICDLSGQIVYANASMAGLLAYHNADDLTGQPLSVCRDNSERLRFEVEVMPALDRERYWRGQARGRRRDGALILLDMTLTKLDDGSVVCAARDITEEVRAEKERESLQARFFQSQKMEAIGQLAGGIAHDFNNILSSILGYASFLTEDLEQGSELHGFAETILQGGQRAKSLVSQILAFSRNEPVQRRPGDLVAAVEEAAEMLKATLPPGIRFETLVDCQDAWARFDATQINQVLMNLCVNARDAMDGTGSLTLSLSWEKPADAEPIIRRGVVDETSHGPDIQQTSDGTLWLSTGSLDGADGYFRITVEDTGCGMPRAVMERMFEPFFTTKDKNQGTGLGLAAVHGIVLAHGGRIDIRSRPKQGTAFTILMPAGAVRDSRADGGPTGDGRGQEHLLVVDDAISVAEMTCQGLNRLGYSVLMAHGAPEALQILETANPPIDLVVTDETMPDMNGLEMIEALRAAGSDLPIILYTGYADEIDEATAKAGGADGFLRKPFEPRVLARMIRSLLDDRADTGDLLFDLSA